MGTIEKMVKKNTTGQSCYCTSLESTHGNTELGPSVGQPVTDDEPTGRLRLGSSIKFPKSFSSSNNLNGGTLGLLK